MRPFDLTLTVVVGDQKLELSGVMSVTRMFTRSIALMMAFTEAKGETLSADVSDDDPSIELWMERQCSANASDCILSDAQIQQLKELTAREQKNLRAKENLEANSP